MNTKAKGSRNEHRSMRVLEAAGYRVTRSAASLDEWDIIGIGSTDPGRKASTANRHRYAIAQFFRYLRREGVVPTNPVDDTSTR